MTLYCSCPQTTITMEGDSKLIQDQVGDPSSKITRELLDDDTIDMVSGGVFGKVVFKSSHFVEIQQWYTSWCAGLDHANVFCLLPSQSPSGFWPYPLSLGLAISTLVCLDFAFHLLSSVISFSWHHLYLIFAHVQTISTYLWTK